jgi:hypothetical protein
LRTEPSRCRFDRLGHSQALTTVYHLRHDGTLYQDLGPSHFDAINRDRAAKSLVRRVNALGFDVDVRPVAA